MYLLNICTFLCRRFLTFFICLFDFFFVFLFLHLQWQFIYITVYRVLSPADWHFIDRLLFLVIPRSPKTYSKKLSLSNLSQIQARFSLSLSHLYHPWLSLLSQGRLAVILKFLYLCRYSVLIIKEFKWQAGEAQFFDCKKNLSKSRLHLNRRLLGDITCSHRPKNNPFFWSQKTHKISWRHAVYGDFLRI